MLLRQLRKGAEDYLTGPSQLNQEWVSSIELFRAAPCSRTLLPFGQITPQAGFGTRENVNATFLACRYA